MNKKIYKLEHLTEYIAKFEKAVPTKICESLTNSIVEAINNNVSFKQTDIELLSNIQTQLYITYKMMSSRKLILVKIAVNIH